MDDKLLVDTQCQPLCEALSSGTDSFSSGGPSSPVAAPMMGAGGLSAFLEDIVSDEEPMMSDDTDTPPPSLPSKDELLQMMDKVDRSIATVEQQINILQRRHHDLEKLRSPTLTTPSPFSSLPSSAPSVVSLSPPLPQQQLSIVDTIYADNKIKASAAHAKLQSLATHDLHQPPQYYQPCEAPCLHHTDRQFRGRLVQYARRKRINHHKMEVDLCRQYDHLMAEWEKRVYRWETSNKKKARDSRNRELFEKLFPELRSKRDQLKEQAERFSRGGVRAFGFVRSEAELDQLAYELYEQEEAKDRHRRTHAVIPPMITQSTEYINSNGVVRDPMALHKEGKVTNIWTDEEKRVFREKFALYPKNFEKISSYLPRKSISDCVRHYYLAKKSENFKQMMRAKKRRHTFGKPQDVSRLVSPLLLGHSKPISSHYDELSPNKPTVPAGYSGWSNDEIMCLKEGLRKYGRAWGKVYRELGTSRTASQCKQFYDDYCNDKQLDLNLSLSEHIAMKNAEKAKRKAELKRSISLPSPSLQRRKLCRPEQQHQVMESDSSSEEEDNSSASSGGSSGSDSESTITDSGTEESSSKPVSLKLRQVSNSSEPVQSPLDIFLMAVESMSKTDPKIALHDHTYARPPMDLEGSSGLQLIAAAAAVVSPGLSRSAAAAGGKNPLVSPVKAPRGRPPSQQRRSSSHSGQKLAPTFLTPTSGSSQHVSLQDKPQLRQRSRSLTSDKSRSVQPARSTPVFSVRGAARPPHITLSKGGKDVSGLLSPSILKSIAATNGSSSSTCSQNALDALVAITSPDTSASNNAALFNSSSGSKGVLTTSIVGAHQRKDGAVLELNLNNLGNLGNMALLLAANQQTALLLPTLGKLPTTLASLLQSGNAVVSLSDSPTTHGNQSIGQTGAQSSAILHIPKITPEILTKPPPPTTSDSIPLVNPTIPAAVSQPSLKSSSANSSAPTTTSEDFSNLNLLSSLVADLSPCKQPVPPPLADLSPCKQPVSPPLADLSPCKQPVSPPLADLSPCKQPVPPLSPSSIKPQPAKPSSLPLSNDDNRWADSSTSDWKDKEEEDSRAAHVTSLSTISQQSLMLYTSSLSLSKHSPTTSSPEEDHLEYATRGISELSKLLGTDNGLESPASSDNSNNNSLYKTTATTNSSNSSSGLWNPDDLLVNPLHHETHSSSKAAADQVFNRPAAATHQ